MAPRFWVIVGVLLMEHATAFTTARGLLVGGRIDVLTYPLRSACATSNIRRGGRLMMAAAGDWTELTDAASGNGKKHT